MATGMRFCDVRRTRRSFKGTIDQHCGESAQAAECDPAHMSDDTPLSTGPGA